MTSIAFCEFRAHGHIIFERRMGESVCQGKTKTEKCEEEIRATENTSGTKITKLLPELRPEVV